MRTSIQTARSAFARWLPLLLIVQLFGCHDNQIVVVSLDGVPAEASTVGVYYRLKDDPPGYRTDSLQAPEPLGQFGISLDKGKTGTLEIRVQAYADRSYCIRAAGTGDLSLSGDYLQQASIPLMPKAVDKLCTISDSSTPVTFPGRIVSWQSPEGDLWVAGDQGLLLRGRRGLFTVIPLPPEVAAVNPTWSDITGTSNDNVWVVGDKGQVVRFTGGMAVKVPLNDLNNNPLQTAAPDWKTVSVISDVNVFMGGTGGTLGYFQTQYTGVQVFPITLYDAYYPAGPQPVSTPTVTINGSHCISAIECWFVGEGGLIFQYYYNDPLKRVFYTDYSMYSTTYQNYTMQNLQGVWTKFDNGTRYLYVVGDGHTMLRSNNSVLTPTGTADRFPSFIDFTNAPSVGANPDFLDIHGSSLEDLYVVGTGGAFYKWNKTPGPVKTTEGIDPLIAMSSSTTATLRSVFSAGLDIFLSGDEKTLINRQAR